jgi:hypothetical protein
MKFNYLTAGDPEAQRKCRNGWYFGRPELANGQLPKASLRKSTKPKALNHPKVM